MTRARGNRYAALFATRTDGWFRVFGYGFAWKDTRKHRLLFSERNGYARCWRLGPWLVTWLTPMRPSGRNVEAAPRDRQADRPGHSAPR